MKINKDIIARDIHGDTVLLNIKTGDYFSLNAVGTDIFYCLQEGKNESETITCLLDKYDVDASGVFKYSPTGGKFSPHYAPNTSGPTIFLLSIDDFNQNNANQQSIYTGQPDKNIKVPSYYNQEDASYSLCIDKKKLLKSNIPRRLTQNQIYSANSIASDNKKENHRSNSQNMSNLFATLTPQTTGLTWGHDSWTSDNPSLQSNKRDYFGPVTLRKLHIKLMDDNGQPINLNGQDWQFSLLIDHVYQY